MTSPDAVSLLGDPLTAAVHAERRLWDLRSGHSAGNLAERNAAVRNAVIAGNSVHDVAEALGVRPSDINRMLEA